MKNTRKSPKKPKHAPLHTQLTTTDYFSSRTLKKTWWEKLIPEKQTKLNRKTRNVATIASVLGIMANGAWHVVLPVEMKQYLTNDTRILISLILIASTSAVCLVLYQRMPKRQQAKQGILFPSSMDLSHLEEQSTDDEPVHILNTSTRFLASPLPLTPRIQEAQTLKGKPTLIALYSLIVFWIVFIVLCLLARLQPF
jgi:hypothetical protein